MLNKLELIGPQATQIAIQEQPTLQLNLYSYGAVIRKRTDEGGYSEYAVDPESIAKALQAKQKFATGLLGPNTIYVSTDGQRQTVAEYRPAERVGIYIEGTEAPVRIPMPPLLMIRSVSGKSPSYGIYAVQGRPDSMKTKLYCPPLPNMSRGGSVCWGNVKKVPKNALEGSDLSEDWKLYLGSMFNSHSVDGKSKKYKDDIRRMLFHVEAQGFTEWPLDDLVLDLTLADALKRVGGF